MIEEMAALYRDRTSWPDRQDKSNAGAPAADDSPAKESGFTLIELAVVVLLISMFTIISVPLFSQVGKGDLRSSARRLSGAMKYLFNEAALTGLEHRLVYDLDNNSYRGEVLEADGSLYEIEGGRARRTLKGDVSFTDIALPGRGTYTRGEVSVRIHPTGWLEETIVHLQDSDDNSYTLRVNPLTGSSEVFEGYREFGNN